MTKRKLVYLTTVQLENLKKEFLAGASLDQLSQKYGINRLSVCKRLRSLGIEPTGLAGRKRTHDHAKVIETIKQHLHEPITREELAIKCGVSLGYLYSIAHRNGIDLPRRFGPESKYVQLRQNKPEQPEPAQPATPVDLNIPSLTLLLYRTELPTQQYPQNTLCHVINDGFYVQTSTNDMQPYWHKLVLKPAEEPKKRTFFFF